jgi:hypothetical protein
MEKDNLKDESNNANVLLCAVKITQVDWTKVTNNEEVITLLKQREELENKIRAIDEKALINYELEALQLNG